MRPPFKVTNNFTNLGFTNGNLNPRWDFSGRTSWSELPRGKSSSHSPLPWGLEGGHLARRRLTLGPAMADSRVQNDALGQSTTPQDKERGGPVCVGEADVAKRRVGAMRGPQGVTPRPSG